MRYDSGSEPFDAPGSVSTCVLIEAGGTRYCLDVARVHGVVPVGPVTRVPGARPVLHGVINVRGRVFPLADLEALLSDADIESGAIAPDSTAVLVGLRHEDVPSVAFLGTVLDVVELQDEQKQPPPAFGLGPAADLVMGVIRLPSEDLALVLHPERLLAAAGATEEPGGAADPRAPGEGA